MSEEFNSWEDERNQQDPYNFFQQQIQSNFLNLGLKNSQGEQQSRGFSQFPQGTVTDVQTHKKNRSLFLVTNYTEVESSQRPRNTQLHPLEEDDRAQSYLLAEEDGRAQSHPLEEGDGRAQSYLLAEGDGRGHSHPLEEGDGRGQSYLLAEEDDRGQSYSLAEADGRGQPPNPDMVEEPNIDRASVETDLKPSTENKLAVYVIRAALKTAISTWWTIMKQYLRRNGSTDDSTCGEASRYYMAMAAEIQSFHAIVDFKDQSLGNATRRCFKRSFNDYFRWFVNNKYRSYLKHKSKVKESKEKQQAYWKMALRLLFVLKRTKEYKQERQYHAFINLRK